MPDATRSEKFHADGKILQRVSDGVGVITFNNPEKRNAMSLEMWEGRSPNCTTTPACAL